MQIQRYSIPQIKVVVDPEVVSDLWVTFSTEKGVEIFTKTKKEAEKLNDGFILYLSQEDTSKLPIGRYEVVLIQARVLFNDGNEVNTDVIKKPVGQVLKEGIMQ